MALLSVNRLAAFYGDFQALYDVSLSVAAGEVVAVIGANRARKSKLLKSIVGRIKAKPGGGGGGAPPRGWWSAASPSSRKGGGCSRP